MRVCACLHMYVHICVCTPARVCMSVRVCACLYVHVHVYSVCVSVSLYTSTRVSTAVASRRKGGFLYFIIISSFEAGNLGNYYLFEKQVFFKARKKWRPEAWPRQQQCGHVAGCRGLHVNASPPFPPKVRPHLRARGPSGGEGPDPGGTAPGKGVLSPGTPRGEYGTRQGPSKPNRALSPASKLQEVPQHRVGERGRRGSARKALLPGSHLCSTCKRSVTF